MLTAAAATAALAVPVPVPRRAITDFSGRARGMRGAFNGQLGDAGSSNCRVGCVSTKHRLNRVAMGWEGPAVRARRARGEGWLAPRWWLRLAGKLRLAIQRVSCNPRPRSAAALGEKDLARRSMVATTALGNHRPAMKHSLSFFDMISTPRTTPAKITTTMRPSIHCSRAAGGELNGGVMARRQSSQQHITW